MFLSDSKQPVIVLGAHGFVGRRVMQVLADAPEFRPIAAGRRVPANAGGIEWRLCDATDAAAVAKAAQGCAYAVNCVAGDAETMLAATRNLCAVPGLRRIVHLSSMAVYGAATGLVGEAHPLDAGGSWYGEAKIACEALLAEFTAKGGEGVILRPGCIHGPQGEQWTARIGRLLQQKRIGDLGTAGDGACNLVYVDDVARAVIAGLRQAGIAGRAFNLADPEPGRWNAYFMALGRAIGATPVRRITGRWLKIEQVLAIPLKLTEIAAGCAGLGRLVPDPIPGAVAGLWRQDIQLDHREADAGLGFTRTPRAQALAEAAAWFRAAPGR